MLWHELTSIERIHATAHRDLVREQDSSKDSEDGRREPPPNRVSEEVNLLSRVVLGPETDSTQQERPLNRLRRVRVTGRERVVVVEHSTL